MTGTALFQYDVLPSPDEATGANDEANALRRLRRQISPYPPGPDGDPRSRALLYGALGSAAALVGAGVASALPDPADVESSGFYLLGKEAVAGLIGLLGSLVAPLAILGLVLLAVTAVVYLVRTEEAWVDALCVAQPVLGLAALGGSAVGWLALIVLLVLNLAIWITIVAIAGAFVIGVMGAALAGLE